MAPRSDVHSNCSARKRNSTWKSVPCMGDPTPQKRSINCLLTLFQNIVLCPPHQSPHHTTPQVISKTKQITIREEEINGGPRRRVNRLWTRVMINVVSDPLLGDCPLKGMGTNPSRTFSDGKAKLAYLLRCTVSCLCMMVVVQSQSEGGYNYLRMHNTAH